MLIGQWREFFFLILLCEEGKITRSPLVLRLPSNILYSIEKLFFCHNGVSFEIVDEEYIDELKDEPKWKKEE